MKQLKVDQFGLRRLRPYLASERASSDAVQGNSMKNRSRSDIAVGSRSLLSSTMTLEEILKITERRWPARYY